jgi:hypothetical protein
MLDLDAIEARAEAATQRPWHREKSWIVTADDTNVAFTAGDDPGNLDFIAHARTDIPALVAELRAAREVVEAAAQRIGGSHAMVCDAYALGPGTTCDCGRDDLAAALAAYRAVVGEA